MSSDKNVIHHFNPPVLAYTEKASREMTDAYVNSDVPLLDINIFETREPHGFVFSTTGEGMPGGYEFGVAAGVPYPTFTEALNAARDPDSFNGEEVLTEWDTNDPIVIRGNDHVQVTSGPLKGKKGYVEDVRGNLANVGFTWGDQSVPLNELKFLDRPYWETYHIALS